MCLKYNRIRCFLAKYKLEDLIKSEILLLKIEIKTDTDDDKLMVMGVNCYYKEEISYGNIEADVSLVKEDNLSPKIIFIVNSSYKNVSYIKKYFVFQHSQLCFLTKNTQKCFLNNTD